MKRLFQFFMSVYILFQIADCSDKEHKRKRAIQSKEAREIRVQHPPRAVDDLMRTNVPLPPGYGENVKHDPVDDSLRRIYDRNYMYYDPDNNFHDDDYWDGYYDD